MGMRGDMQPVFSLWSRPPLLVWLARDDSPQQQLLHVPWAGAPASGKAPYGAVGLPGCCWPAPLDYLPSPSPSPPPPHSVRGSVGPPKHCVSLMIGAVVPGRLGGAEGRLITWPEADGLVDVTSLVPPLPSVWFMVLATDDMRAGPFWVPAGRVRRGLARLDGPHDLCGRSMPARIWGGPCAFGTWNRLASGRGIDWLHTRIYTYSRQDRWWVVVGTAALVCSPSTSRPVVDMSARGVPECARRRPLAGSPGAPASGKEWFRPVGSQVRNHQPGPPIIWTASGASSSRQCIGRSRSSLAQQVAVAATAAGVR